MLNYSDNALMAKVRALYGRRLKREDYEKLLLSKTIADVAAFLKNDTAYGGTLGEVKEELIHRGQLETFVRRRSLNIYTRLLRYSYNDKLFLNMYMMENECKQLLLAIRFLNANSMDRYIIALPAYLSRYMSIDLFALARMRSFDDLLDIVSHSVYYDIIARFRPVSPDRPVDIMAVERALLEHYYRTLLDIVNRDYSGDTREELTRLLQNRIDHHNLSAAYRLKRYFAYPEKRVRDSMLDIKTDLNPARAYDGVLSARDEREIDNALRDPYLVKKFGFGRDDRVKELSIRLERSLNYSSHRTFRFSVKPMVVVISYMFLLEIEVSNIVNIIEGIRYQMPPDEIRDLLVI